MVPTNDGAELIFGRMSDMYEGMSEEEKMREELAFYAGLPNELCHHRINQSSAAGRAGHPNGALSPEKLY
jgi:hypothetical protein